MAADPVVLRKSQIIEQCLRRMGEEMGNAATLVQLPQTAQDSVLLNLERACQAAIDLAMRLTKLKNLGIPNDSRDAFALLFKANVLSEDLFKAMSRMVGFRNTAIHDYQGLNLKIVDAIVRTRLEDFRLLVKAALAISITKPT